MRIARESRVVVDGARNKESPCLRRPEVAAVGRWRHDQVDTELKPDAWERILKDGDVCIL